MAENKGLKYGLHPVLSHTLWYRPYVMVCAMHTYLYVVLANCCIVGGLMMRVPMDGGVLDCSGCIQKYIRKASDS